MSPYWPDEFLQAGMWISDVGSSRDVKHLREQCLRKIFTTVVNDGPSYLSAQKRCEVSPVFIRTVAVQAEVQFVKFLEVFAIGPK